MQIQGSGRIVLPDAFLDDLPVYDLHPALLDAATQGLRGVGAEVVPYPYDAVRVHAPLEREIYAHTSKRRAGDETVHDIVVTNGPMIDVKVNNMNALGRAFTSVGAPITLTVTITSPDWAEFDTLEVFANTTPDPIAQNDSTLVPLTCWTSRTLANLDAKDPCKRAPMAPQAMTVQLANLPGGGGFRRYEATVTVTLDAQDIVTRAGASGTDAWLVFRARGDRAIFPLLLDGGTVDATTRPAIMSGDFAMLRTALTGKGVSAMAVTTPVFVDFDGGGYRAPFAP